MFHSIKRATRAGVLGASLLALLAGPTTASGADVSVGRESLDGVAHLFNICDWEVTETAKGQIHWTVAMADEHHGDVTVQEVISTILVFDDDPDVPASLRGATWRGHNMISFVTNFDPTSEREITRTVQHSWEGPFRGLSERFMVVIAADGTVRVDRQVLPTQVDWVGRGAADARGRARPLSRASNAASDRPSPARTARSEPSQIAAARFK